MNTPTRVFRHGMLACSLCILLSHSTLFAQQPTARGPLLRGQVLLVDENGIATPSGPGVEVTNADTGATDLTDSKGLFRLQLTQPLQPGSFITLTVKKTDWAIWQPEDGKTPAPQGLLTLKLLPKGSKKFWTDHFIQTFIESTAEKAKLQVKSAAQGEQPKPVDFTPLIREWATKYGFTPEEAKAQIEKWSAEVQKATPDFYKLGLAAFADRNFRKAGELFSQAGQDSEKRLKTVERQKTELEAETVRNYQKAGDAHYSDYAFAEALAAYEKSLGFVSRTSQAELWARLQVEIGLASDQLGTRADGLLIHQYLAKSIAAYRAALEVYTREQLPQQWAATQNNLGIALQEQGTRSGGEEGRQLLGQAVAAYRAALEVRTRGQLPQDWAATQNNLGIALQEQGTRSGGEEGRQLLRQAVAAYRAALEVFTREQLPQQWAATQNNLGNALQEQGTRSGGEEGRQLLGQAVAAYRAALEVYTRGQLPQQWAMTQNNLAKTLALLSDWTGSAECYRNVLKVYPNYREGYSVLANIYHERLFDFSQALALYQAWTTANPDDLSAKADQAECLFTLGRFAETLKSLRELTNNSRVEPGARSALLALQVGSLAAQHQTEPVPPALHELIAFVSSQPADFKINWIWAGTLHFVETDDRVASVRPFLASLFKALEGKNRDEIAASLHSLENNLNSASSAK